MTDYRHRLRAALNDALVKVRLCKSWLSERAAHTLQPRIGRELRSERTMIHEHRRRVHVLVLLAELARLRRFPPEHPR